MLDVDFNGGGMILEAPKLSFRLDLGSHVVKTVETTSELFDVLRLRHEVYFAEAGRPNATGLDCDEHDMLADHVIIEHKGERRIIGTYRLLCSRFTDRFYSAHEFELDDFLRSRGVKLELGRACVAKEHRNGVALSMLWKGLAQYARLVQADQLFGCGTIWNDDPRVAWGLCRHLQEHYGLRYDVAPRKGWEFGAVYPEAIDALGADWDALVPPLMRTYFLLGAKVYGAPAHDKEFSCADFFTVMELNELSPRHRARFFGKEGA